MNGQNYKKVNNDKYGDTEGVVGTEGRTPLAIWDHIQALGIGSCRLATL